MLVIRSTGAATALDTPIRRRSGTQAAGSDKLSKDSLVAIRPKACAAARSCSDTTGQAPVDQEYASTTDRTLRPAAIPNAGKAKNGFRAAQSSEPGKLDGSADDAVVELGRPGEPCRVGGKVKRSLTRTMAVQG